MNIIAVVNQKGGVGKTTTVFQLARAATQTGLRTLVVDLDPQGNLTSVASREQLPDTTIGVADALSERTPVSMADVLVPGVWDGLMVAPTVGDQLAVVRNELIVAGAGREHRLSHALSPFERFDLVLIDCPPSLDQLTVNALTAASKAVIVTQPRMFSASGFAAVLDTIRAVTSAYNPALTVGGVVVNLLEEATVAGKTWTEQIKQMGQLATVPILDPPTPKRQAISDATEAGLGIDQWRTTEASVLATIYQRYIRTLIKEPIMKGADHD